MKRRYARHWLRCDLGVAVLSAVLLAPATAQARTPFDSTGLAVVDGSLLVAQASFDDLFETTDDDTQDEGIDADENATVAGSEDDAASATESTAVQSFDDLFDDTAGGTTAAAATAATTGSAFHFNGFVQNELGYTYAGDDPHFQKFLTRTKLFLGGRLSPRVRWQIGGHFQYNPVFDFETFYPNRVARDQEVDGWIDETFLDIDADNWEFRIGRQHIIWGEMVGLFFADVVSPLDLRQFILPDFDLIRIPQWAVRAEYYKGDFHGELIYIPYMTTDDIGKFGAEYFPVPVAALLPPGVQTRFLDDKDPNDPGEDFGFGTRASYLKNGWDMSLFYYTSPDKTVAFERELLALRSGPTVLFRPVHERIHQVGTTVSKEVGAFVVKAEGIQTFDRLLAVTRPTDPRGLVETDELRYVIGADWAGAGGYNANFQFFQTWFQDHDRDMLFDKVETGFSFLVRTTSWHPKVTPEILWIRSLNRNEWLLQAKVSWDFARNWRGTLGADIFEGKPTGLFGQFDETDRVYYELRFSF